MKPVRTYTVVPSLPDKLKKLRELAYNLWWCWDHESIDLFRRLDSDLWEETYHNPVKMLGTIKQETLEAKAKDDGFLAQMERTCQRFEKHLTEALWYQKTHGAAKEPLIAYFSAEFGITDCLPIYSGGMGILAGDYLKSSSELGLPMVGVGLLYQVGYFRQQLNFDGWQYETYPTNDFYNMPIQLQHKKDGTPLTIEVEYPGRKVTAQIWLARIGRVSLLLLDTNVQANTDTDRRITGELYGGDLEMRIQQEVLLGIGGVRALHAVGMEPAVYHMNEGHSAFMALERIRNYIEKNGLSFAEALELTKAGNVFTTHTPVPAGIDVFPFQLMEKYFKDYCNSLALPWDKFLGLGRQNPANGEEGFSMAVLAFRLAAYSNGVSELHGIVSRRMWQTLWPQVPEKEVPIISITNGIHHMSWVSHDMAGLYDRYLGPQWAVNPPEQAIWEKAGQIPDEELWRTHERRRERLVAFARKRLKEQLQRRGASPSEIAEVDTILNPGTLTIGFARRFATYKRASLILRNPERLAGILSNKECPVQIIFAGKAHPRDNPGKELIKSIVHFARDEKFKHHVVFLEDYDMAVSRYLVQGVDIWLNTPRRPHEASGTSGMKAAVNGVINMSVLDGWWDEAYKTDIGWAIGKGEEYSDQNYQDEVESNVIYDLIEKEVIPLFYERGSNGLPRGWIARMKSSMRAVCPVFNTNRMAREYTEKFYLPALSRFQTLNKNGTERAKELAKWKSSLLEHWSEVRTENIEADRLDELKVGSEVKVRVDVRLGLLKPDDVSVEVYHGGVGSDGLIREGGATALTLVKPEKNGVHTFTGKIPCRASGLFGYAIRILPKNKDLCNPYEMGLVFWSKS